jgi:hypothetical protein
VAVVAWRFLPKFDAFQELLIARSLVLSGLVARSQTAEPQATQSIAIGRRSVVILGNPIPCRHLRRDGARHLDCQQN